jgi:hypothetical protein
MTKLALMLALLLASALMALVLVMPREETPDDPHSVLTKLSVMLSVPPAVAERGTGSQRCALKIGYLGTLLSAKFSWSNSLGSWFQVSRDKICATFNVPRGTPESLSNGEPSLDFTYYEQATNHFRSPHLAESRV